MAENLSGITKKKIGLALGGGGAKGLAHIGVIKELIARGESETHEKIAKICEECGYHEHEKSPFEKFMNFILYD